jgi:hypothetical protein
MISASRMIFGTGVNKTFHGAKIFRGKWKHSVVFGAYVRIGRGIGRLSCADG